MIPRVGFRSVPLQMKEKKGFGSTVLGWFVVKDEPSRPESTEDLIAKYANEQGAELPPELTLPGNLPTAVHGKIDFAGVFKAAGIDQTAQSRVDQAANLLKTLPTEATREVKKQIVEAAQCGDRQGEEGNGGPGDRSGNADPELQPVQVEGARSARVFRARSGRARGSRIPQASRA